MSKPYYSTPGSLFPTHFCKMGHCISPGMLPIPAGMSAAADRIKCCALVYKKSGLFSHHCEATLQPFTPEVESTYRIGGEWAVQDLLGIMEFSVARRYI